MLQVAAESIKRPNNYDLELPSSSVINRSSPGRLVLEPEMMSVHSVGVKPRVFVYWRSSVIWFSECWTPVLTLVYTPHAVASAVIGPPFGLAATRDRRCCLGHGAAHAGRSRAATPDDGADHTSKSGSRAFVVNGQVVSLNIPLTMSMTPVEIGGGWRFVSSRSSRFVPYGGGGVLIQAYSEKSHFAGAGHDVSQINTGFTAFGGLEVDLSKWLIVGGEAQFRGVPNAIGKGGVSQDFGETNLGGFALRVLFGIRR